MQAIIMVSNMLQLLCQIDMRNIEEDVAALRRGMIDLGSIQGNQGFYWRSKSESADTIDNTTQYNLITE